VLDDARSILDHALPPTSGTKRTAPRCSLLESPSRDDASASQAPNSSLPPSDNQTPPTLSWAFSAGGTSDPPRQPGWRRTRRHPANPAFHRHVSVRYSGIRACGSVRALGRPARHAVRWRRPGWRSAPRRPRRARARADLENPVAFADFGGLQHQSDDIGCDMVCFRRSKRIVLVGEFLKPSSRKLRAEPAHRRPTHVDREFLVRASGPRPCGPSVSNVGRMAQPPRLVARKLREQTDRLLLCSCCAARSNANNVQRIPSAFSS